MKIKGYRILVEVKEVETISAGGIIIIVNKRDERMEASASQIGVAVQVGHTCWKSSTIEQEPWCYVGDTILFSKHSGRFVYDPEDNDKEYMVIQDTDVIAVIKEKDSE
jgi:co-chaperonin GroES (HSP10)